MDCFMLAPALGRVCVRVDSKSRGRKMTVNGSRLGWKVSPTSGQRRAGDQLSIARGQVRGLPSPVDRLSATATEKAISIKISAPCPCRLTLE